MGFKIENGVLIKYTEEPGVTEVVIPDSVTSIGYEAFYGCKSLTAVTIPDSVTSIGWGAFEECKSLTAVTIPDSVTSIGESAFRGCTGLADDKGLVIIRNVLYCYHGNDSVVTIPDSVTSIGEKAFYGCKSLTSVTIPDSVTSIGDQAFHSCKRLTSVTIPDSVTSIGWGAFEECKSLTSVTIPDSVTSIGAWAFYECKNLTSVTIPDSVTSIGDEAFSDCSSLTAVTIPDSVTSIGDRAFYWCSLTAVTIPDSVTSIGESAFRGCTGLADDKGLVIIRNVLYSYHGNDSVVTIPDSVTSIGDCAFYNCKRLTNITIPDSVTSIGESAFESCKSLTSVTIPDSVKSVGRDAFKDCYGLKTFNGSLSKIPGYIPVDKIIVSDDYIKTGDKIDPKLIKNIKTKDIELLSYLLVYQTAKAWKQHIFDYIKKKDRQAVYDLIPARLRETDKVSSASAAQVLEFTRSFINDLSSESITELYAVFKEKKCNKQLKEMDDDANIQGKMNSADGTFTVKKPFYESFIEDNKIKTIAKEIKNLGITMQDIPDLIDKDGQKIPKEITAWLLTVHGTEFDKYDYYLIGGYDKPGICSKAKKIISRVAPEAFQKFLNTIIEYLVISVSYLEKKRISLAIPICRYADEEAMASLTSQASKWSYRPFSVFSQACLYSNTRSAMLFAERYHELDKYAELRGMDEDTFRDMYLSDIGLDTQGGKAYDLGNQTVTARLQKDLSFIFELPDGKTAKSLPKKGADTDKYEAAKKDFDEMKKAAKKILKSRSNVLFEDFLSGETKKAQAWKDAYINNPLLRNIAKIVVWSQDSSTFVLTDSGAIDCSGQEYTITDEEIIIAHPMKMEKADVTAWQKYFADNNLKQPFAQVWEPACDPKQISPDRYKGCMIPFYRFANMEKHGITVDDWDYHNQIGISFRGCKAKVERIDWDRHTINMKDRFEITDFHFGKFTRQVNHIVAYLDRVTVMERIQKDDITVMQQMDSFTVAQIIEFISMAQEAGAVNVTAALLEYRNNTYPDYNVMDEFVLDW